MKKLLFFAMLVLLAQGCGQESPGMIDIKLEFDGSVTDGVQNGIKTFVFVIREEGTSKALLYPSSCLVCPDNKTSCASSAKCFKSATCGFETTKSSFDPQIDFTNIPSGKSMNIISCALDITAVPVSSGSKSGVKNSGGESATITMTTETAECTNNLPAVCS